MQGWEDGGPVYRVQDLEWKVGMQGRGCRTKGARSMEHSIR